MVPGVLVGTVLTEKTHFTQGLQAHIPDLSAKQIWSGIVITSGEEIPDEILKAMSDQLW